MITGIVLAGGKSSRFGSDKALAKLNGKPLIEYSLDALKPLCDQLVISSASLSYDHYGYQVVPDNFQEAGPLAGIEACMRIHPSDYYLVASCDIPFAGTEIFELLLKQIGTHDAIALCDSNRRAEPLIACYSAKVYPNIKELLETGKFKVGLLLQQSNCKLLKAPDDSLILNINTLESLQTIDSIVTPPYARRIEAPMMLMIAGSGRETGKTWLGCEIIRLASQRSSITALKVSPHFHPLTTSLKVLLKTENFILAQEMEKTSKDSGRFLRAGAEVSLYLQLKPGYEEEAYNAILPFIRNKFVVCESGGLHKAVSPAFLLFVKGDEIPEDKAYILSLNPVLVDSNHGRPKIPDNWTDSWLSLNYLGKNKEKTVLENSSSNSSSSSL